VAAVGDRCREVAERATPQPVTVAVVTAGERLPETMRRLLAAGLVLWERREA
jgi:hypothetical protein